jgi:circadian clock protein KaiB
VAEQAAAGFVLCVFVSAKRSELCDAAVARLRSLCETHLNGAYELEVIDVDVRPDLAEAEGVVVVPTVIRMAPPPQRRVIGDLSDDVRTVAALGFPDPDEPASGRWRR